MKTSFILLILGLSICSCSGPQNKSENQTSADASGNDDTNLTFELIDDRDDKEKALDALTFIQKSSGGKLYSTFPHSQHDCKGVISYFKISKEEFEAALLDLLNQHYRNMSEHERAYLASTSVQAQDSYTIKTCGATSEPLTMEDSIAPPRIGMWVFQGFLDQTDLIIEW
ncbi:MAG: hypothetical protein JKY54_17350 [Flavobacteriales bacterium]|nr:hypothetical protein [Flavobacteriales bacterium]